MKVRNTEREERREDRSDGGIIEANYKTHIRLQYIHTYYTHTLNISIYIYIYPYTPIEQQEEGKR